VAKTLIADQGGNVQINGPLTVLANAVTDATHFFANRNGLGPPHGALASAELIITDGSGDILLGNVLVQANGIDHGNIQADAIANALVTANGNIIGHSFEVVALADQTNALGGFPANGSALAGLSLHALHGDVSGDAVAVEASALDHGLGAGLASGKLFVAASNAPGKSNIALGNVTVKGSASNWGGGPGLAPVSVTMNTSGNIHAGNVDVEALANDHGPGVASAHALSNIMAGQALTLGSVTGKGVAVNVGGGAANAAADLTFDPRTVVIGGNVLLSAVADNHSGANAAAHASLDAANINTVQVTGAPTIIAHGTNSGAGPVTAQAMRDSPMRHHAQPAAGRHRRRGAEQGQP